MSTLRSLAALKLFDDFGDDELYELSKMVTKKTYPAETVMFQPDDHGQEMFIILSGCMDIFKDFGAGEEVLTRLGEGEMFGEMSILDDTTRNAGARVAMDAEMLVFGKDSLHRFLNENLRVAYHFFLLLGKSINRRLRLLNLNYLFSKLTLDELRKEEISETLGDMYAPISYHGILDPEELEFLKRIGDVKDYGADDIIVDENEVARDLFLLLDGSVSIVKLLPDGVEVQLVALQKGNIFGEMSFLDDGFRSARVKTNTGVTLLSLNRQSIERNKSEDMLAVCKLFLVALQNISHNIRLTTEVYNKARAASG